MNLAAAVYWFDNEPFIDRFKTSAGWSASNGSGGSLSVSTDALGNPLAVPTGATAITTAFSIDLISEPTLDVYVMTYKGSASFTFAGAKILSSTPGSLTFEANYPSISWLSMTVRNMTEPLSDIHIVRQDQAALFQAGEIFNPAFVDKLAQWDVIRFMDWGNTNASLPVSWADRATERDLSWAYDQSPDGVPLEVMIKLANKAHTDMWYNVPTQADDGYVRNALTLIRDTLDPALKVHVEYTNEPWNWAFPVASQLQAKAAALWGDQTGNMDYYGYRSAQIAKIAHDVFGTAGANRIVDVLGAQNAWPGLTTYYTLNGIARAQVGTASSLFSEYAVTTYFTAAPGNDSDRATILSWARSGETGMAAAFHELEFGGGLSNDQSLAAQRKLYALQAEIAKANGLTLVAYEGGAHLVPSGSSAAEIAEVTTFFGKLMEDPRMGTLYTKMIADFAAAGGKSLVAYNDVGTNSKFGYWGVLDTIYDDGSPRYDALVNAAVQDRASSGIITANAITAPSLGTGRASLVIEGGGTATAGSGGFVLSDTANARVLTFSSGGLSAAVTVGIPAGSGSFQINPVDAAWLKLSAPVATVSGPMATIEATNAAGQTLTVTSGESHRILGAAGPDRLTGNSGADVILGGAGADTINGEAGNDHLYGQSPNGGPDGADSISGGDGSDYVQGNAGNDTLDGGAGSDRLFGGADNDSIIGGSGNDTINGNLGDDSISGGADNDSIRGGQGNDLIYGDAGDDIIGGDLGNDILAGGSGIDRLSGGDGADTFRFAAGDASFQQAGDNWLTDFITDFASGTDKLALGFSVTAVLIGAAQTTVPLAWAAAQALFNNHAGDREVAAIGVGGDTMLFFSGNGGGTVDSAVHLAAPSGAPVLGDFV